MASSSQTQGSSHSLSSHDVFLSFRNIDTDKTFADHLCKALNLDGVTTLFYDSELRGGQGNPLVLTIEMSKIIIVVLSENYASSRWCLDELVEILRSKHQVVPIFYHLHPALVRQQTGEFGNAFRKEKKKKNNRNKAQSWKAALTEVANLRGHVLRDLGLELELKRIPEIVKKVKLGISNSVLLHTATTHHPVSLKSGTRNLEEAYNKPPFPIDTLWTASQADETEAQLNFLGKDATLFDIKDLCGLLEKASQYKLLHSKSVAVRNLKVMHINNSKIPDIPDNLSFPHLEKLILQANLDLSHIPSSFFKKMPALKVLDMSNASINTLPPSVCELIRLEKLLLRRCDNMRELTRDIGALKNLQVLDLSGCTNLIKIPESIHLLQRLSSLILADCKSLTELPQSLCMLISLQNLNLSGCTNLVEIPETIEFLQRLSSLFLNDCKSLTRLPQSLCVLRSLRNLSLSGCTNLAEILGSIELLDGLSLLRITDCKSLRRLPQSICMLRSLQNLHLSGCTNLAEIPESIEFLEGLSSLTLTDCKSLTKLPQSICMMRILQNLHLFGCTNLAEIPESIEFLEGLSSLTLADCKSLTKLPHSLCMLRSLQYLNLSGWTYLAEIPESIEFLEGLTSLILKDCKSLKKLPHSLCMLRSLQNLDLSGCTNLAEIPESIEILEGLSSLVLTDCRSLRRLPQSISMLRSLQNLNLSGCTNLAYIPEY